MNGARFIGVLGLLLLVGCHHHDHEDGHDHDHDHDDHHNGEEEGPEPLAITRWTEGHELFVELDPPRPGQPVGYHAHITHLEGFKPATQGTFTVKFYQGDAVAAEAKVDEVARAGIFTPEAPAPAAGTYRLEMTFADGDERAVFDCGEVVVADEPVEAGGDDSAALSFLKEQQWKVPFATAWAKRRPMAREIELPATLQAPGADQLTIASPTSGRFFHHEKVALAEGILLKKGAVVGSIAPTVAGDDFSRLQLAVDESKLEEERARRELARVEPLVEQGLLPERRIAELESEIATAAARLKSASRRVGQVVSPGGEGGIQIEATRAGVIAQVLAKNGAPVTPGQPLVRLVGDGPLWAKARFVTRPGQELAGGVPVALRVDGERLALGSDAGFLSSTPIVDQSTQLASWTAALGDLPTEANDAVSTKPGAMAVLLVRVGAPEERVAVPEAAVVELDTRRFVFVQTGGESFEKRRVTLGVRDAGYIEVLEGVKPDERVVTLGGFDIHLAAVMGNVASHHH